MNDELLKLADDLGIVADDDELEAFYRAAFNAGVEASAKKAESTKYYGPADFLEIPVAIRALEIKP